MPNLILFNANIYTHPPATAIAWRNRRILAVGDDDAIKALAQPHTRQIDLAGRLALPGLTDAHFHFYNWALGRHNLQLVGAQSLTEVLARLKERVLVTEPGRWVKGYGWNESEWPRPAIPSRQDLDAVTTEHPVILWRSDLHLAVANSLALQLAGLGANTPDPPSGVIERDVRGQPTGVLKELAIELVRQKIPSPSEEEGYQALLEGLPILHKMGLTGLHDQCLMGGTERDQALRAYQQLHRQGQLKLRVSANIHYTQLSHAIELGLKSSFGDDCLRLGFVKLFADGSMGAHTAWMLEPYQDGGLGMPAMPVAEIVNVIRQAEQHGWAVSIHAIGDRANRELLDIFETMSDLTSRAGMPHRIEHVQLLHPVDIPRLARLGLTASVQPVHLLDDMVLVDKIWGERGQYAYAFRSLLQAGTVLAFGSDCPVADPNPWLGIHAAVNRRKPSGQPEGGWYPEQCLTVAEAVWGYTLANATAIGQHERLGSLVPGKLADLIVLDRDIFNIDPLALAETQVLMTIFDGEIVYEADSR
jgi:hypothetical protein